VPKDISYENNRGKIVAYFYGGNSDGIGYTENIIVGGTDSTAVNDGEGPEIEIYFNEASSGGTNLITPDTRLIVRLNDETGINTTGTGIGHKLEGIIDGQENNPVDLTNYFLGDPDAGGRSGEINYQLTSIEEGEHSLKINAWDIFNNPSTEETYFRVVSGNELVISDIYNYPNPFSGSTTFTFQKNLNRDIDVRIKIYTVAGRLIQEIERRGVPEEFVKVDWDGRDGDGNRIGNGTYLYKIIIKTTDGSFNKSVLGKLAVIR
jgi:hypothetical protein